MSNIELEKQPAPEEKQDSSSMISEEASLPQQAISENAGETAEEPAQTPAGETAEEPAEESAGETDKVSAEVSAEAPAQNPASARKNRKYILAHRRALWKKRARRMIVILCVLLFLAVSAFALMYYIKTEENTLEVSFYHLQSDNVESPFRIVQLSDLHLHEFGEKNAELVDWVKRLAPDIIAITGDMNNHFNDDTHVVTELCSQLTEITDVYYVMGNHEWVDYIDRHTDIKKDIVATGVKMLENSYVEITVNGNKVVVGGLVNEVSNYEKYTGPQFMEKFMNADGFKILLVHYPEFFLGTLNHYAIDLAMCGHTHGGIVRIPRLGGLYASDQGFLPELYEGMQTVRGGSVVVISRGLGGESKIPRINNNPEIVVVDVSWY